MKKLLISVALLSAFTGSAAVISETWSSFSQGTTVPDGDLAGWQDTRSVSADSGQILTGITLTLELGDGFNGDIYARLNHGSDYAVLLNRTGRTSGNSDGYSDAGFSITFNDSDTAAHDVHLYVTWSNPDGGALTGTWLTDGRDVDPSTVLDTDSRSRTLANFLGKEAGGTWSLYLADLASGEEATMKSWSLHLDTASVPEPGQVAMMGVVLLGLSAVVWRRRPNRKPVSLRTDVAALNPPVVSVGPDDRTSDTASEAVRD